MTSEQEQRLTETAKRDMYYLQLLTACMRLEPEYQRIISGLPAEEREVIQQYITLCEELDHRRCCIAMELGKP